MKLKNKLLKNYIPYTFLKNIRIKYNLTKNMSVGLCTIFYYLFYLKKNKIYITNFNLNGKYNKNVFTNTEMNNLNYDFINEKRIIKQLIMEGRVIEL